MSSFSNYTENGVLNHLFRATSMSSPANVYLGLFTSDAGLESNTIASATEVVDSAYSRVNITTNGSYTAPSDGVIRNVQDLDFAPATVDWGTITHTAVLDAATGGNVLAWGALTNPRSIHISDAVKVRANTHSITLA